MAKSKTQYLHASNALHGAMKCVVCKHHIARGWYSVKKDRNDEYYGHEHAHCQQGGKDGAAWIKLLSAVALHVVQEEERLTKYELFQPHALFDMDEHLSDLQDNIARLRKQLEELRAQLVA